MILRDGQGGVVELGESVGRGGEAVVYRVNGQPTRLAKIYEPAPRPEYQRKLGWMAAHPPANPTIASHHASLAWPASLIYDDQGHLKGYLMPFIRRTVPLLDVFNPRRRVKILPQFDARYLHRLARNLASALEALHNSGYVAGDLNESNVLVLTNALVTLIDADSFQVTEVSGGKEIVHPCPVGKFEYTAPELQGKRLSEVIRKPEHDDFGLAVLVFQLLMEGNHPFRAQWQGKGEPPPLEARIASGAFPYTASPSLVVLPPRHAPDISWLHPALVEMFRRCFVDGHTRPDLRPSPRMWRDSLNEAEHALVICPARHVFSNHLSECPHCARLGKHSPVKLAVPVQPAAPSRSAPVAPRASPWQTDPHAAPRPAQVIEGVPRTAPAVQSARSQAQPAMPYNAPGGSAPVSSGATGAWRSSIPPASHPNRPGTGQPAPWLRNRPPPASLSATQPARPRIWSIPVQAVPAAVTAQPYPPAYSPAQVRRPASTSRWLMQTAYRSFLFGGASGALSGALPGMLWSLIAFANAAPLNWPQIIAIGGGMAGLSRGWQPGYRAGIWIERKIGWLNFLQGFWIAVGGLLGLALGIVLGFAILPILLGPIFGALLGREVGRKLWQVGNVLGWDRIWAGVAALGTAALGWVIAGLVATGGLSALGPQFFLALENGGVRPFLTTLLTGAFCSALGGLIAGAFADFIAGLMGLSD